MGLIKPFLYFPLEVDMVLFVSLYFVYKQF